MTISNRYPASRQTIFRALVRNSMCSSVQASAEKLQGNVVNTEAKN